MKQSVARLRRRKQARAVVQASSVRCQAHGPVRLEGTCQAVVIRVRRRANPSQELGVRSPPLMEATE